MLRSCSSRLDGGGDALIAAAAADVAAHRAVDLVANRDFYEDYVRHGFPMGRLGTAEEVADVIVFTASPRAHWINGRNMAVDGLEQPHAPLDRRPF
jgi:NAD(P)-dependent dehydrogenase (short-subunit alcohol dehydrogenase family)